MGAGQFTVSGEVRLATDQAVAGTKQVRSEVERLASTGIAGFERVQQRVIDLTKRMAELRNELLRTSDPARQAQLNAELAKAQTQLRAAKTEMRGVTMESQQAVGQVQMLAGQFGVQVPAGIARLMSRLPALQGALQAAFSVTVVLAFGAAIVSLFPKIADWIDQLRDVRDVNQEILNKQIELNRYLAQGGKEANLKALTTEFANTAGRINEIKNQLKAITGENWSWQRLKYGFNLLTDFGKSSDQVKALVQEINPLIDRYDELTLLIPKMRLDEHNQLLGDQAGKTKAAAEATERLSAAEHQRRAFLEWETEGGLEAQWDALWQRMDEAEVAYYEKLDQDTRTAMLKAMNDQNAAMARGAATNLQIETRAATERLALYEKTASQIEQFIDRVFLTARSLSDVFRQFLMQLLGSFTKWVSQMLASWLTGVRSLSGSGGGGGGLFGSLLGGLFGGSGGGSAVSALTGGGGTLLGATAATGGTSMALAGGAAGAGTIIQGLGSPLGAAASPAAAIPSAAGGASSGALGRFAFGGLQSLAPMITGGGLMAGIALAGHGGLLSGLGGGAMAGLFGTSLMASLIPAIAAIPGIGWIAAGVGALVGGLAGIFKRGRQKKDATSLEQQYEFASNDVLKSYLEHELDYESAISQMQDMIVTGRQALTSAGLGKWGRKGADNMTAVIAANIAYAEKIEKERQQRVAALSGQTIPEFGAGGYTGNISRNGQLAIVHPYEFVLNAAATKAIGVDVLNAWNRAPRFAEGGAVSGAARLPAGKIEVHFHVQGIDGQSVANFFRRSEGYIVSTVRKAVMQGAF